MGFTKTSIQSLRNSLNHDVAELSKKYGMDISLGNASYRDNSVTFKLDIFNKEGAGGKSKGQVNFETRVNSSFMSELTLSDFGKSFTFENQSYKIVDAKLTGAKFNILCENKKNKGVYGFKMSHVAQMLKS